MTQQFHSSIYSRNMKTYVHTKTYTGVILAVMDRKIA